MIPLQRSTELNANLTKGAGNSADILRLLRLWPGHTSASQYFNEIVLDNPLGRSSRSRLYDVVHNVLARRYFPGGDTSVATRLAVLADAGLENAALSSILYYHAALAEHLLYRVATEFLYQLRSSGIEWVNVLELRRFVRQLPAPSNRRPYSDAVVAKIAGASLTALREFGIVSGARRKRILPAHLHHAVVGYVAYALREEGASGKRIVEHRDWRLFLLSPAAVDSSILDAQQRGHFRYHVAGDIRRFDWTYQSLDEYVDALTGITAQRN